MTLKRFAKGMSIAQNYIGQDAKTVPISDQPVPTSPSFKPTADIRRGPVAYIWTDSIRAFFQRYHISLKRVESILSLKDLEASYAKGIPQTRSNLGIY
ncbi:hypothetical protein C8R46DRAFT_1225729 [Mycena filopes]|nr:hypothetical protein C8R46DRAFT_1225729 [Mycena filopes]